MSDMPLLDCIGSEQDHETGLCDMVQFCELHESGY